MEPKGPKKQVTQKRTSAKQLESVLELMEKHGVRVLHDGDLHIERELTSTLAEMQSEPVSKKTYSSPFEDPDMWSHVGRNS